MRERSPKPARLLGTPAERRGIYKCDLSLPDAPGTGFGDPIDTGEERRDASGYSIASQIETVA